VNSSEKRSGFICKSGKPDQYPVKIREYSPCSSGYPKGLEWHSRDPPMEGETLNFQLSRSVLLDSSVVIKWFRKDEVLRDRAIQLRQAYLDGQLTIYVPDLLVYEIANVLRYKPDLDRAQVQQALESLYAMQIKIEDITAGVIRRAIEIAYSYDITVYDAAFVAMAEHLETDFITADEKLGQKLQNISYVRYLADLAPLKEE
jgi:predicted nucleic acid-binding protein